MERTLEVRYGGAETVYRRSIIMPPEKKQTTVRKNVHILGVINSLLRISLQDISLEKQLELSLDELLSVPFLPVMPKGGIFLVEDDPEVLVLKAHRNLADSLLRMCAEVPFGKCLCGQAAKSGRIEFSDRVDERHHIHYNGMEEHGHYNIPILSKNKVLGVIVIYLAKDHVRKKEETDFLHAVADTLAGIIENKRVEEKLQKTAATLAEAQRIARFGNWEWDIIKNALYWSDEIYSIFGLRKSRKLPTYELFLNSVHPEDRDMVNRSVELALHNKKSYSIDHRIVLPNGREKIVHEQAEVTFDKAGDPVRMAGTVQDITGRKQSENKLLAINELLNALNQTQSQFITDTPSRVLFEQLLTALLSLTKSEYGFIGEVLYSETGDPYLKTYALTNISWNEETRRFYNENAPAGMEFRNLDTLFGAVLTTVKPVISNDPVNDKRSGGLPEGHPPLNAFLGIPLLKGSKFVGMVGVANRPGGYTTELIKFMEPLTNNCANIIEAYRIDQRRQKAEKALWEHSEEVTALTESSNIIGSISLTENLYETICDVAVHQFKLSMAWIGLLEEGSDNITIPAYADNNDGRLNDNSSWCMGPAETAIKTKSPQIIAEIDNDTSSGSWKKKAMERGYHSVMAVPLINSDSKVIGILNFYSSEPKHFTKKRRHLLNVYSNYVAVAIENRLLIEGLERKVKDRTGELRNAMLQAESANKAKSDFLANMSHELRTPLNAIIGFSEMMFDGMTGEINEKQKEFLTDVIDSSHHLLSLINDILDLSKIEAGKMKLELSIFDLQSLLRSSMDMFKHKTTIHNINTELTVEDELQSITADKRKIKQVIFNLIGNAMKFTPDNGSIFIHAKKVLEQPAPSAGEKQKKSYEAVEISVKDTGNGIPAEHIKMLFRPFEQPGSSYLKKHEGTGLGLTLCKQIIDLHGGRIDVESKVGKGTTFSFIIPLDQAELPDPADNEQIL